MNARFTDADLERANKVARALAVEGKVWGPTEARDMLAQAFADVREECAAKCEREGMWDGKHFANLIRSGS